MGVWIVILFVMFFGLSVVEYIKFNAITERFKKIEDDVSDLHNYLSYQAKRTTEVILHLEKGEHTMAKKKAKKVAKKGLKK